MDLQTVIDSMPAKIKCQLEPVAFEKGDIIIHQGQEILYGFLLMEGAVAVLKANTTGREYRLSINENPSFSCFMEIYAGQTRQSYTIKAHTRCAGYRLSRSASLALLKTPCQFQEYLIRMWATLFTKTARNASRFPNYSIKFKLAMYLQDESFLQKDGSYRITESKNDIASAVGCSRRTLFRLLNQFKEKEFISCEGRTIFVSREQADQMSESMEDCMEID